MATVYLNADTGDDSRTYVQAQNSATPWKSPTKVNTSAVTGDTVVLQTATAAYTLTATVTSTKNFTFVGATTTPSNHKITIDVITSGFLVQLNGVTWSFSYVRFTGCKSANSSVSCFQGITSAGWGFTATNCEFYNNDMSSNASGISGIASSNNIAGTITLANCALWDNVDTSGTGYMFGGRHSSGTTNTVVMTNCVFDEDAASNVCAVIGSSNAATPTLVTIRSCEFNNRGGGTFKMFLTTTPAPAYYSYNDAYLMTNVPAGGTGNLTSDPLLVDPAGENFNLRQTSPCIGTGSP